MAMNCKFPIVSGKPGTSFEHPNRILCHEDTCEFLQYPANSKLKDCGVGYIIIEDHRGELD